MKRDLLPVKFAVKCLPQSREWKHYIKFLNEICNDGYAGDSDDAFYGLDGTYGICDSTVYDDVKIMSLDEVLDIIGRPIIEMVIDYNGDEQEKDSCVFIGDSAPNHANEWALQSHCTYCVYNGQFALNEDVTEVWGGEFVIDGTESNYDIVYSDHEDQWLDTNNDNVVHGTIGNGRGSTGQDWFIRDYRTREVDEEYYLNDDALRASGYIYSDRQDEWVHEENWEDGYHDWDDDNNDSENNNAGYHDLSRRMRFDSSARFTIGFEIEKEDEDLVDVSYSDLYNETGWIKEKDGSLDNDTGYELVSPAFNLFDNKMDEEIADNKVLRDLINADKSSDCGGHINLGSTIYTPEQLFEGISGFFPLFYTMYEHRLNKSYSKAKKKHEYYNRDKYSSIFIKPNVVEIRIPSAVVNVENLIWRRDLMRIITENINKSEMQVLRMLLNSKSKLHIHLRKVYSIDKMIDKIEGFVKYSEEFNNVKLPKVNSNKLQKTNKLGA